MRILLAGFLGAIAMFIWMSIAHLATPLATTGISQIPNEGQVTTALTNSIGAKHGLFIYPWMDPKAPNAMAEMGKKYETAPHGILIYHPAGTAENPGLLMAVEFAKELVECLIVAFLLAQAMLAGYLSRAGFVSLIGFAAALTTNGSYWAWYGFPTSYTLAYGFIDFFGYVVAGFAIAAILKPRLA
jgi:hypothetical protein